jgi:dolichol kinase
MHSWMLFQVEREDYVFALQIGTLGSLLVSIAVIPLLKAYASPDPAVIATPPPARVSVAFIVLAAAVVGGVLYPWSCFLLETWNPFKWLVDFIFDTKLTRVGLIVYWLACLVVLVPLFAVLTRHLQLRTIIARKLFHLLVVVMFVPAYFVDAPMLALSYGVALSVFVLIECIRSLALPPFGKSIALFMNAFIDHREGGRVILTHSYLLLGCALPLWLAFTDTRSVDAALAANAGILALGIGDAMGAVIGSLIGKRRLFGKKTIEGTAAIFVSIGVASTFFHDFHGRAWDGDWTQVSFAIYPVELPGIRVLTNCHDFVHSSRSLVEVCCSRV